MRMFPRKLEAAELIVIKDVVESKASTGPRVFTLVFRSE